LCCGVEHGEGKLGIRVCKLKMLEKRLDKLIQKKEEVNKEIGSDIVRCENEIAKCLRLYKVIIELN